MRSEIVFVSPPIAQFGSQISPDNSIFEEWQFEHRYSVIKVFDGTMNSRRKLKPAHPVRIQFFMRIE